MTRSPRTTKMRPVIASSPTTTTRARGRRLFMNVWRLVAVLGDQPLEPFASGNLPDRAERTAPAEYLFERRKCKLRCSRYPLCIGRKDAFRRDAQRRGAPQGRSDR